jgi:MoxR-like ATPase
MNVDPLLAKVQDILAFQNKIVVEARERLYLVMIALLTPGAHTLLWGEPGVAKSMLFDGIAQHAPENLWFKTPAFKGSPPEQFLGPISLSAMTDPDNERYERIVKNKFGWAEYVFCDELFRAPRAVLPAFQTGMSDGVMDNGNGLEPIPLRTFFGASNSGVEAGDDDLAAFWDRFIIKIVVERVQAQASYVEIHRGFLNRRAQNGSKTPVPPELLLSRDEIDQLILASCQMRVSDDTVEAFTALESNLLSDGVGPSVRRTNHILAVLQTDALLRGQDEVTTDNFALSKHCLWTDEDERGRVEGRVLEWASKWDQDAAALADSFDEFRAEFIKLQGEVAQVGTANTTPDMLNAGLRILKKEDEMKPTIEQHIKEAAGRDTKLLNDIVEEIDRTRDWVQAKLAAGLMV